MLSERFIAKVKLNPMPGYKIAHAAGLHPSTLSKLLNGIERTRPGDRRILALARVLGLSPEECFVPEKENLKCG